MLYSHTLIGIFSTLISISIFISAFFIFHDFKRHSIFFLGLIFFLISVLDILFTFSSTFSIGVWFWSISRVVGSVGIFLFVIQPNMFHFKTRYIPLIILSIGLVASSGFIIFHQDIHTVFYNEKNGITQWFIYITGISIFFYFLSIIVLNRKISIKRTTQDIRLTIAIIFQLIGMLFFIYSTREFSYLNSIVGEALKAIGYTYLYSTILVPKISEIVEGKKNAELRLLELQKELSNQILQVQEEERTLLSRDLHDGVGQSLYSVIITLNAVIHEKSIDKKDDMLLNAKQLVNDALTEVRDLAHSLRPSILDDFGFIAALKAYIKKYMEIHRIQVELDVNEIEERLHPDIETALFRICQEALINCAKHSNSNRIIISIDISKTEAVINIQDNGRGFELQRIKGSPIQGIGLLSIKERAERLGGEAFIHTNEMQGTTVHVRIPHENPP